VAGPARQYSTKQRAKRIELEYFKRPHPFRRWKTILSLAAPLVAGLWLVAHAVRDDQTIYTSGPVSIGHAMFEKDCRRCHVPASSQPGAAEPAAPRPAASRSGAADQPAAAGPVAVQPAAAGVAPAGGGFWLKVTDHACVACHAGPVHHDAQAQTPSCTTCHVEHAGRAVLATLDDHLCTSCHARLALKPGHQPRFEPRIAGFARGHPEFAIGVKDGETVRRVRLDRRAELEDTAQVKLNHQKHMKVGLKGLDELQKLRGAAHIAARKDGLQLSCTFCHETDPTRATIRPISYERHCGPACHPLDVDGRLPGAEAPHDQVPLVHAYLRTLFLEAFEDCQALRGQAASGPEADARRKRCQDLELLPATAGAPAATEESGDRPRGGRLGRRGEAAEPPAEAPPQEDRPRGGRLGRRSEAAEAPVPEPPADAPRGRRLLRGGDAAEDRPAETRAPAGPGVQWVAEQLQGAERLMYKQKCEFCHVMTGQPGSLPRTEPTAIPVRWLPHSVFDHGAHRPVACAECHPAATSTETTDVLLPSVTVCRDCHHERGGARPRCVECHLYHDKSRERPLDGPFTVPQLAAGAPRRDGRSP